jgi:ParB/RepB/Spo0J family partition protein
MSAPQQLALAQIDRRFAPLRLASPRQLRRLHASVQSEGRIRDPVLVSTGVEERCWVLVDGFKRLRVAEDLGLTHLWVLGLQLDTPQAKAAILHCNQARHGVREIEEAWIVHSLCREHGMRQTQVAQLLKRDKSWVCRRLQLLEALDESLQEDVRLGLLSPCTARELAQLPRGNQVRAADAVREHQLTVRQSARLVQRLRETGDPQAVREVLQDPLRYLGAESRAGRVRDNDPRLSSEGNRLRRVLLSWQGICGELLRELPRLHAADAPVLAAVLQEALRAGTRAMQQLEAIHSGCGLPPPMQAASHA